MKKLINIPTLEDIEMAHNAIKPLIHKTPVLSSEGLNQIAGCEVYFKCENFQKVGAFKMRGASCAVLSLTETEKSKGIATHSSGNHAQGVAMAAQILGIPAIIVMPKDAPEIKLNRTRAYGAEVRLYCRQTESREEIASDIAKNSGAVLVPSFDDPHIIAGQGTCGLELVAQAKQKNLDPEILLSPCGGGGLIAGVSVAVKSLLPNIQIYAVEPEGFDDHSRSLQSGRRESIKSGANSFCDALLAPSPGKLTWEINERNLCKGLVVSDAEVAHAISFAFHYLKLVIEPGGAVALAALLYKKIDVSGSVVGLIVSGGNVDPMLFSECLRQNPKP